MRDNSLQRTRPLGFWDLSGRHLAPDSRAGRHLLNATMPCSVVLNPQVCEVRSAACFVEHSRTRHNQPSRSGPALANVAPSPCRSASRVRSAMPLMRRPSATRRGRASRSPESLKHPTTPQARTKAPHFYTERSLYRWMPSGAPSLAVVPAASTPASTRN